MTLLLGCMADDFTGKTNLTGMLVKAGMRTVQLIGVPDGPPPDDADAVAESLAATRTFPVLAGPSLLMQEIARLSADTSVQAPPFDKLKTRFST